MPFYFIFTLYLFVISLRFPRFIMPGDVDLDDLPYEDMQSDDEELEEKQKEKENRKRQELLAKVDFSRYAASGTVG